MDSEDDHMNNANGHSKFIDIEDDDSDDDTILYLDDSNDDTTSNGQHQQKNYTVLNEEDICQRVEEDITTISTVLTISKVSASILLQHYNWIVSKVHDAWFADEEKVRSEVGLLERPVLEIPNTVKEMDCGTCFESFPIDKMNAAACGHLFCSSCWTDYISKSITDDGPGCLMLRCPEPSCRAAVGQDMINLLASDEDKQKYSRYLIRSYIENNRNTKWCPAPGCNYAVDLDLGSGSYDVSCKCSYGFCWNCTEEAHHPVDCSTVANWILKSSAQNTNWILANSKPCPKCKRPIEKNHGGMHMVCTPPCEFHFCWLCLSEWADHGEKTGGYNACNRYEKAKEDGEFDEAERRREMAKTSLQRYTHYYKRWATNHSLWKRAVAYLDQMNYVHIKKLREKQCQLASELKFLTEAWVQIIECRRVLKWTYAYGYYLPEQEEHTKKQLFEYLQGQAEFALERLHECAKKEIQWYLNSNGPSKDFVEFRKKLAGLTRVTRNYFENLVQALENGLSDVKSQQGACSKSGSSKNLGGTKATDETGNRTMSRSSGPNQVEEDYHWFCEHCTYANEDATTTDCQMCNLPRYYLEM